MMMGTMNTFPGREHPTKNGEFAGPGGAVICNWTGDIEAPTKRGGNNITDLCYTNMFNAGEARAGEEWCGSQTPRQEEDIYGHWMFGTEGIKGSNALLGAQTMFRYGSSAWLDAVELPRMGITSNFGQVGTYPVHFHLMGFPKQFREYLPPNSVPKKHHRDAMVTNCSIYQSFNRWVVLHGSHGCDVINNVGLISYGSSWFIEDGVELNNDFQHNIGILCLPTRQDDYYNPPELGLIPNVASDICWPSTIWLKNSQNRVIRNICCNSPYPTFALWIVPQIIYKLRGISTVLIGDPELQLPGMASLGNAQAWPPSGLSQNQNPSTMTPPCWAPEYFSEELTLAGKQFHCAAMGDDNAQNPYSLIAENVSYQIAGFHCEFPDTHFEPGIPSCRVGPIMVEGAPLFMPVMGQNACTDAGNISRSIYFPTPWGGGNREDYPYQPIPPEELEELDQQAYTEIMDGVKSKTFPKLIISNLSWNLCTTYGNLLFGAGWAKQSPAWLINNCFLSTGGGEFAANAANNPLNSSAFSSVTGDANNKFPNVYQVIYNHITNGAIVFPPNPTVFGGPATFLSDEAAPFIPEYTGFGRICGDKWSTVAVNNYYFMDGFDRVFPDPFWLKEWTNCGAGANFKFLCKAVIHLYDLQTQQKYRAQVNEHGPVHEGSFTLSNTRKFPYVCGDDGQLLMDHDSAYSQAKPENLSIVANFMTQAFITEYGISVGQALCKALSQIEPCNTTAEVNPCFADNRLQRVVGCE